MQQRLQTLISLALAFSVLSPSATYAQEVSDGVFTNQNWQLREQPHVATFTTLPDGSYEGVTDTGIPFRQYTVSETNGMRIDRFEIQEHYHYIVEGRVAYSLEALSTLIARITQEKEVSTP